MSRTEVRVKRLLSVLSVALVAGGCASPRPATTGIDRGVQAGPDVTADPSPPSVDPANDPAPAKSAGPADHGIPPSLLGSEWTSLPTSKKVVALTFDAGANNAGVAAILATLAREDVPGTFFLTGRWTELFGEQAREIAASYPVGNHTYDHPYLTSLSEAAVRSEISRAGDLIRTATGREDRPLFRFPYGDSDARTIGIVNDLGYGGIRWTVDTAGWKGTSGGETVESVVDRVLHALQPGAIVLMHVGSNPEDVSTLDADALPRMIDEIRARGYGFVTVDRYL